MTTEEIIIFRSITLAGPPRHKKNYECEQKFEVLLNEVKLNYIISIRCSANEKISDIIEKYNHKIVNNSKKIFYFDNKILNPNLLVSESQLYPLAIIRVITL